ncbi:lipase 1 [Halyomorpha halys]|uniref:lipase 1 n=1 Tax=Halyomorpha halys TaxID=286706 RepID=UPI0034D20869
MTLVLAYADDVAQSIRTAFEAMDVEAKRVGLQINREKPRLCFWDELAERGGYKATNYELITEDGYSIWLHRIGENSGSPVLIQHGIIFHESGVYDLPAAIDKILEVHKVKKIFAGHSLGTITFSVMCTIKPEYNNKVEAAMFMSPVVYLKPVNRLPPIFRMLAVTKDLLINRISRSGSYDLGLRNKQTARNLNTFCGEQVFTHRMCLSFVGFFARENPKNLNLKDWSNFLLHVSGTSLKTLVHDLQLSMSDKFQQFDYGSMKNILRYNAMKPPKYDLNLLTTPIGLFWTYNDQFADEKSVKRLERAVPNLLVSWPIEDKTFSHLDMVIGDNANIVLYPYIIKQIEFINMTRMQEQI